MYNKAKSSVKLKKKIPSVKTSVLLPPSAEGGLFYSELLRFISLIKLRNPLSVSTFLCFVASKKRLILRNPVAAQ